MSALAAPEFARQRLEDLLTFFGVNTEVKVSTNDNTIELSLDSDLSGTLIGHRGETLLALQHMVNMLVRTEYPERWYVHVDIGGYRQARMERLEAKAVKIAERVVESGKEVVLPPMTAAERRHVHSALADREGVVTESRGDGNRRRLVIRVSE
ncbi:KH domain-containing protein [Patescibacteria group bacterium]|nr:MAG: KH domain-containing protein [Patescibacteria group bacterium]